MASKVDIIHWLLASGGKCQVRGVISTNFVQRIMYYTGFAFFLGHEYSGYIPILEYPELVIESDFISES